MPERTPTPRQRARAAMTADVIAEARRQLGVVGAAGLSVRSVTRELGIAPSAVYRYFASRDHLLTAVIIDSYDRLGDAVTGADARLPTEDVGARWLTSYRSTRAWSVAHPHEYGLLYGTPLIGYAAPSDTIAPATRVVIQMARVVIDAQRLGLRGEVRDEVDPLPTESLRADAASTLASLPRFGIDDPAGVTEADVVRIIRAWTELFGTISFELFGHYANSVEHPGDHLDVLARAAAVRLGLPDPL
ncbi:TetR/AcrR family transcriptional regulator [Microlunatus sp. Y2014]|uniref:TetR/AcrR family transcriptional regulator n=1 Tax=Microlunatus sp. Y2014 TaxID=3418488 RepID=UPI003DA6E4A3